jgi:hypothetical protein
MKAKGIEEDIDKRFFKKDSKEMKETVEGIKEIRNDFSKTKDLDKTSTDIVRFLKRIWEHYSLGAYTDIFIDFAKAEKALYGFSERYRDHLMHAFNVYYMGVVTLSRMLKQDEDKVFELLKVREESSKIPFPSRYDKYRRLYYLWCLISTFHDIAIPIDYRKEVVRGLGKYLEYFRIGTEKSDFVFPFMTQFEVSRYADLMSYFFASGLSFNGTAFSPTYKKCETRTGSYLYFRSVLADAMNDFNHSVWGAYFLFKSIEELFLSGSHENLKYDLDICAISCDDKLIELSDKKSEWDKIFKENGLAKISLRKVKRIYNSGMNETKIFNDYVFEQDVTRAALAIALHNIDPDKNPKIFPIKFSKFPLSSLLILFDELQEFYRPEGLVLTEIVRCRKFPLIHIERDDLDDGKLRFRVSLKFDLEEPEENIISELVKKYNDWAKKNKERIVKDYGDLVHAAWGHIFSTITKKIDFGKKEQLMIKIVVTVKGKEPNGKPLEHASFNWVNSCKRRHE